ncbi:MAG: DNA primase [Firmicutes bacterium]|nr:DNA primase [Bacillota bacterium]
MGSEVRERVRDANDIVDIIGERVQLKRQGKNYIGLCPFHQEKTPSFTVSPEKQLFYCFGCQVGGDVFKFIELWEKTDFRGSLEILAERAGIPLREQTPREQKRQQERKSLYKVLNLAARYYQHTFLNSSTAEETRAYCTRRGIKEKTARTFELGYAPPGWDHLIRFFTQRDYSTEILLKAGLVLPGKAGGYYDRFRHRLIFPIRDHRGRVVAFGGRVVDDSQPKYLNSPETSIYSKRDNLYGLHIAADGIRQQGWVLIVEGYLDAIMVHQSGWTNVVASLGTALTGEQAKLLARYSRRVLMAYDADAAGQEAALRSFRLLRQLGCQVQVVPLPEGSDPDSHLRREGVASFAELLENSLSLVEYRLKTLQEKHDLSQLEEKVRAVDTLIPLLLEIDHQVEREILVKKIAAVVAVSEDSIWTEIRQYRGRAAKKGRQRDRISLGRNNIEQDFHNKPNTARIKPAYLQAQEVLLSFCLFDDDTRQEIIKELSWQQFTEGAHRELARAIWKVQQEKGLTPAGILAQVGTPEAKTLLSQLSLEDDYFLEQKEKRLRDCLFAVKRKQLEDQIKARKEQIISLEREGKSDQREKLLREIGNLQKQFHNLA